MCWLGSDRLSWRRMLPVVIGVEQFAPVVLEDRLEDGGVEGLVAIGMSVSVALRTVVQRWTVVLAR